MFCYTYLTNIECGLRELSMWSEISSEHPLFLQNVANCLNIALDPAIVAGLNRMNQCFAAVHQQAQRLLYTAGQDRYNMTVSDPLSQQTAALMQQFLQYDQEFLAILRQLRAYGPNQPVWQTLVEHIQHEQTYMYNLIAALCQQIFQTPYPHPGVPR